MCPILISYWCKTQKTPGKCQKCCWRPGEQTQGRRKKPGAHQSVLSQANILDRKLKKYIIMYGVCSSLTHFTHWILSPIYLRMLVFNMRAYRELQKNDKTFICRNCCLHTEGNETNLKHLRILMPLDISGQIITHMRPQDHPNYNKRVSSGKVTTAPLLK